MISNNQAPKMTQLCHINLFYNENALPAVETHVVDLLPGGHDIRYYQTLKFRTKNRSRKISPLVPGGLLLHPHLLPACQLILPLLVLHALLRQLPLLSLLQLLRVKVWYTTTRN